MLPANALAERLAGVGEGGGGQTGIGAATALPPEARARIAGPMAEAFASTLRWALAVVVVVVVAALALLPEAEPEPVEDPGVKGVFEKVGVSSRGKLVHRMFAEHYAPPPH